MNGVRLALREGPQLEAFMRKQDRIANQQQSRPQEPPSKAPQPAPREGEHVKGSASESQPMRPERQPGKLPLPD